MSCNNIFVDVRINCVTRLVEISEDEAKDPGILVDKIFSAFQLTEDERLGFVFRDNLRAPVDANLLPALILQRKGSGSFFIELVLDEPLLTFRAESLKNHIQELHPESNIFDEAKLLDGVLSKKSERLLTDSLFSYIIKTFSKDAKPNDIAECCKAALQLFPYLETSPSEIGGIESLYNSAARKGIIYHKIRNAKTAAAKKVSNDTQEKGTMSETELRKFLKYCVVNNDKKKLKEVLRETVTMRRALLKKKDDDLKDFWTFYFVDTDLILFDFGLMFENIDDKSLHKKWNTLHDKPLADFKDEIDFDRIPTIDIPVWQFLTTCMACKPRGDFWKTLSTLIIFSTNAQEDPMNLLDRSNSNPHIIAIVPADRKSVKYYIGVRDYLVTVPEAFGIIGAVDLVYKLHKIFDIEPHTHCKRLINFLDFFVYEYEDDIKNGAIDRKLHELGDKLLKVSLE